MSLHKEFIDSIFIFINQFKNEISRFLKPRDSEEKEDIDEYNFFQTKLHLLLYHEKNHPYVQIVKNNFMNLNKSLSISDNFVDNSNIKEQLLKIIDRLAFSILEARFNNKVEIEPIVQLIQEYGKKFNDEKYWSNPTNSEFMALCSAIPFTLSPKDQFRKKVILKAKMLIGKEEDDDDYSSQNSESNSPLKSGDYRTVFKNNEDDNYEELNKFEINCEESNKFGNQYEKSIKEALNLSTSIKISLQTKYCASSKNWTKIIWDIFIDLFNTKLKEIDLEFDINDKQLIKSWYLFDVENYAISKYFYALYSIPDFDEKESLIYSFMSFHSEDESKIRSAYVYAFISSYIVLKDLTSFGYP